MSDVQFSLEAMPSPEERSDPRPQTTQRTYARRDNEVFYIVGKQNGVRKVLQFTRDEFITLYDNMGACLDAEDIHNINGIRLGRDNGLRN